MGLRIHNDHARFKDVIRGVIKNNLKEYIKSGEFISKQGSEKVSVPISRIDLPHFRFLDQSKGGVGQGEGKEGDSTDKSNNKTNAKNPKAGSEGDEHALEMEVSLDELADMLGEALGLPAIKNKGYNRIKSESVNYSSIHHSGPNALRHFKRTYKNALKRQIASNTYNFADPVVVPIRDDCRYKSYKKDVKPQSNAVIIYMMDVSGSMGDEQKEIVRIESFWIDTWLRRNYDGIECRYIIHDAMAKEVDRHTFFHTRESGGTMISSAYKLCADIIAKDYPSDVWNIYPFHFSDGDNWSVDDTRLCVGILRKLILPYVNQFSYGQVESPYGSGQFIKDLEGELKNYEKMILSEIKDKDSIYKSIKQFLGNAQ